MIIEMKLAPEPFSKIKDGSKIYELRLNDEKRSKIKVGDIIKFAQTHSGESLFAEVISLHAFKNFACLYSGLPLDKCGYTKADNPSSNDMYKYYSKAEEERFGVLAIKIKVLNELHS